MKMQRLIFRCAVIIGILCIIAVLPADGVDCSRTTNHVACRGYRGGYRGYQGGNGGGAIRGRNGVRIKEENWEQYEFSYALQDDISGTDFSNQQSSDGEIVTGLYSLVLPDGTTRNVEYIADEAGFRSKASLGGESTLEESKGDRVGTQEGRMGGYGGFRMSLKFCNKLDNECVGVTFDSSALPF